jgi:crotonobetainyl-CoA:carnitine CoA-transferase CaiB-like acyl-CoA transferase
MTLKQRATSLLEAQRVLDLTEGGYLIAGKTLGDLGADVIKIEPLGGSPSRKIGPFYGNTPDPEKSLFWFAYNANKRGITLDLQTADGRKVFRELVKTADFVLESFEPGYMEKLGLGYKDLCEINPRIIMTSITPFGQTGPYAHYQASDLTTWAMGGFLGTSGSPDRPPVWVSFPQASLHAGVYAAAASMIAHWHRKAASKGQHIDVSTQQCVILALYTAPRWWEFRKVERYRPRTGPHMRYPKAQPGVSIVYPCQDGEVFLLLQGGANVVQHHSSRQLVKYMVENKMASDWLRDFNWIFGFDAMTLTQEVIDRAVGEVRRFFLTKTKKELYREALKRRILLAPIADARDISENPQLRVRDFWDNVEHPELGGTVPYCGPFLKSSEASLTIRRRPPLIGEHNEEINKELRLLGHESVSPLKERIITSSTGPSRERPHAHPQALEGVKVADFSWAIVGPLAARHLADHGAQVVRVESHARPETNRFGGPYKDEIPGIDRGSLFSLYNSSKYGMSLNLSKPKAREVALRLMQWADVVIESFTPGTMRKNGLDYETIKKAKPDIIYISTSCYGQYGPFAESPGYGQLASAQCGIYYSIGWPDRPSETTSAPHTDFIGPIFLVPTVIAALDYRSRTGKGLYVDQSQVEAGVQFYAPPVMDYMVNKKIMMRGGNHWPYAAPHNVYPCLGDDRWCAIAVFTDEEWKGCSNALGNPPWTQEAKFSDFSGRKENEEELDRRLSEWTARHTPKEVMEKMQEKGVAAGIVQTMEELYQDPQLKHLGFWRYLEHPVIGVHAHQGPPFRLSETPDRQFTSPCLGQHNDFIYKELLGYSDEEMAELLKEGVITTEADLPAFKASF